MRFWFLILPAVQSPFRIDLPDHFCHPVPELLRRLFLECQGRHNRGHYLEYSYIHLTDTSVELSTGHKAGTSLPGDASTLSI